MNPQSLTWLTPTVCIGEVMHARTRPTRNIFRYPLFFLRIPLLHLTQIGKTGLAINRKGICQLLNRDHGPRDGSELLPWVREILSNHHLGEVTRNGEVMLQTMPRILGYLFNPVSFYFCHDPDGALRAVICEVSNTFGERHHYIVAHPDQRPILPGEQLLASKVFHVSPFFPVEGHYEFRFGGTPQMPVAIINYIRSNDGVTQGKHGDNRAESGDGHPGLRTWLKGDATPLNKQSLRQALLKFPLMTFGVITRIHWQALRLWINKVTFHTKPAPPLKETTS